MTSANRRESAIRAGWILASLVAVVLVASACSTASTSSSASAAAARNTASPSTSGSATALETTEPTAVATAIDPCTLVTSAEASTLTGVSFAAGDESTTAGNGKLCSYGQAGNVFEVLVGVAPDAATAEAGETAAEAEFQKAAANGLTLTELKGFADGVADAATLEGSKVISGQTFSAVAIYVLKGTIFFAISDVATLGAVAPSSASLQAQAMVVLGRLP